jgi:hypothetical protein
MHWENHVFELPRLPSPLHWHLFTDTKRAAPHDVCPPGDEAPLHNQMQLFVGNRSVVILVGRL